MLKNIILFFFGTVVITYFLLGSCQHPYQQGQALYEVNCQRCHGDDGEGFENLYPSIHDSPFIQNTESLSCIIVYGSEYLSGTDEGKGSSFMPDNRHLTGVEVLNIVNYLSFKMGDGKQDNIEKVTAALQKCEPEE